MIWILRHLLNCGTPVVALRHFIMSEDKNLRIELQISLPKEKNDQVATQTLSSQKGGVIRSSKHSLHIISPDIYQSDKKVK